MRSSHPNRGQYGRDRSSSLVSEAREMWRRLRVPTPVTGTEPASAPVATATPQRRLPETGQAPADRHMATVFEAAERAAREILAEAIRERSATMLAELEATGEETATEPEEAKAPEPVAQEERAVSDGASLLATRMALAGSDPEIIEQRLRSLGFERKLDLPQPRENGVALGGAV
jgi:hypothetical protein